ncbi:MAG TPA: LOG family protein [Thermohalobaculum sp.]|nr:LOG family protein [Thermohalobaculum sp.]
MKDHERERRSVFRSAERDADAAERTPQTPQTQAPAYRLAYTDLDFLERDELRPVRLQLELMKPQLIMEDHGIESTVVFFGGARIPPPELRETARTETQAGLTKYYEEARKLGRLVGEESVRRYGRQYVVATGGGPGVMEAANMGAHEAGAPSLGLNIVVEHEQAPNAYVTPAFSFNFHYFGIRKMHFLMRAKAVAVFPGGFGTLDELFETLTLIQTRRMERVPVLLFGRDFWTRIVDWEALADAGTIAATDLELFHMVETAEEGWAILKPAIDAED